MSIALLYAAFAALWIIASGNLLTFAVDDATLQGHIEQAKGLTFVAVTSSLLYLLLKGWHKTLIDPANVLNADIHPLATNRLLLLFGALILIVPLIGLTITTKVTCSASQYRWRSLSNCCAMHKAEFKSACTSS